LSRAKPNRRNTMMRIAHRIPTIKNWSKLIFNRVIRKFWIGTEAVIESRKKFMSPRNDADIS